MHLSPKITCLSLNVNGLRNDAKRTALWHSLLKSNGTMLHDVVMLQEVHHQSDQELVSWLQSGAGRGIPIPAVHCQSAGTSASGGVVILLASHLSATDVVVQSSLQGRLLVVTCRIMDQPFCFVNVYAPHEPAQRACFFSSTLSAHLPAPTTLSTTTSLWGGDWNCIECPSLDQSNSSAHRESGFHSALAPILSEYGMHDAFRTLHPHARDFSFSRVCQNGSATYSRLDRWYVSDTALSLLHSAKLFDSLPSIGVDHRCCIVSLHVPHAPTIGKGVWSMPTSVLHDDIALQSLTHTVQSWLDDHPVSPSFTAIQRWLSCKLVIKHHACVLGKRLERQRALRQHLARRQASSLAATWAANPSSRTVAAAYHAASMHASDCAVHNAQRSARLAGVAWSDHGERCTAWFHRLGRQRKQATIMHTIRPACAPDGVPSIDLSTVEGIQEGGDIIADFFDSTVQGALFQPGPVDAAAQQDLLAALDRVLTQGDVAQCDAELQLSELKAALLASATSKKPGLDGLPYELYSALWPVVGQALLDCWHECMSQDSPCLPPEMVEGCIVLLYKGGGSREELGNYRPITLLNADYKLIAKAYAQRFGDPAATVVDDTQTAFLPGRWIGDNVLHHLEEVDYLEATQTPGCILFLDFAKAYDRMDRDWIQQCMQHMGFGERARAAVRCLLAGTRARAMCNGHLTRTFDITSGVAQGSPLSPLLYVLAAQPLAAKVRQLQRHNLFVPVQQPDGLGAPGIHQHADDTTLHAATATDAEVLVDQAVQPFCRATNSRLNAQKSKVLLLGGAQPPAQGAGSGISYPTPGAPVIAVRHLGIMLGPGTVGETARQAKFVAIKGGLVSRMLHWSRHSLSTLGRAHVAKQCLASMLVYHATFSSPSDSVLSSIDGCIAEFVHKGPMYPSRAIAQLPRAEGGISMACPPAAMQGLQASLVCRYLAGATRSWHAFWDFWFGLYTAPWQRPIDALGYGRRALLLHVDLRQLSPRMPARVSQYVNAFRRCGLSRVSQPQCAAHVAREPMFYHLHVPASVTLSLVVPSRFPALYAIGARSIGHLFMMYQARFALSPQLLGEVSRAYHCVPEAWQQLVATGAFHDSSISLPLHAYTICGGSIGDASVKLLTVSALRARALPAHTAVLPVRPALWSGGNDIEQHESRWVAVCDRGSSMLSGVRRNWDEAGASATRAGAPWIDDGRRVRPSRHPPRERGGTAEEGNAAQAGPLYHQQTRGPSVMGPTSTHTSWWHRLIASHNQSPQPSPSPWGSCWQSLWGRGLTRESIWVLWCLGHAGVPCGARQRYLALQAGRESVPTGRCSQMGCEQHWDTLTHAFLECPEIEKLWQWVSQLYVTISGGSAPPLIPNVVLCGATHPGWQPRSLWYLLRGVVVGCVFQARAQSVRTGQHVSGSSIACMVVSQLRALVRQDWLAATRCSAVRALFGVPAADPEARKRRFHKRWKPGGHICVVTGNVLTLRLTTAYPVPVPS
jgi:exonuclease III